MEFGKAKVCGLMHIKVKGYASTQAVMMQVKKTDRRYEYKELDPELLIRKSICTNQ